MNEVENNDTYMLKDINRNITKPYFWLSLLEQFLNKLMKTNHFSQLRKITNLLSLENQKLHKSKSRFTFCNCIYIFSSWRKI